MSKKATRACIRNNIKSIVLCKRSVSPVVATALLIGIVIAMAAVIMIWALSFVKESGQKLGKSAEQACSEVNIEGSIDGSSLVVINRGNIPVHSLAVKKTKRGVVIADAFANANLAQGSTGSYEIGEGYESIEIIPVIMVEIDNSRVEHTCENYKKEVAI